jgi:hypothetical protein
MDNDEEPPSSGNLEFPTFLVGRDSHGNWVVQDQRGLCGGLFVDRTEAIKFAMFENGHRPQSVIMVPGVLELDMSAKFQIAPRASTQAPLRRVA